MKYDVKALNIACLQVLFFLSRAIANSPFQIIGNIDKKDD